MLKTASPTILFLAFAAAAHAQRDYSHTVILKDGSSVTYRTHCSGSRNVHCVTTEGERGPKQSNIYTGEPLPDKHFCKAMSKSYGDNLERFAHPIGYNLSFCITDPELQVR